LQAECTFGDNYKELLKEGETDSEKLYKGAHVYAKDLVWKPEGRQGKFFPEPDGVIRPTNPDILLVKMRPGQVIDMEMHCVKGIGADHAKFSPVATASYRLLPTIDIVKPILGPEARKFARCFPKGVIGLEEVSEEEAGMEDSGYEGHAGEQKAVVRNTFKDTVSRECLRHDEFAGKVKLGRVRDHFIFMVESTGQFESDYLFLESVKILKDKCARLKRGLANVMR
jgi:DNA-directed RNA polymerase I and III subunit RPAC1